MNSVEIYIHGTPRGHQIWGSGHNHDYISTFYNHDSTATEKAVLQIDVCAGDSFYTYVRRQGVFDFEGRPEAFFALTVSFHKAYCRDVYKLYHLFDAVYSQLCLGSILGQSGNAEKYMVSDFSAARSGGNAAVDRIHAAFKQKIEELIMPSLAPISFGDTFNRRKKVISLMEVDSPLFFDEVKEYSVVVSPGRQPSALAYVRVSEELKAAEAQKKSLSSDIARMQSEIAALSQENKNLSIQLRKTVSSNGKKFDSKVGQLQSERDKVAAERDEFKQKLETAACSIKQIEKPFQQLSRLLAGRFPDDDPAEHDISLDHSHRISSQNQKGSWREWLNTLLLGLVVVCCVVVLVVVLNDKSFSHSPDNSQADTTETIVDSIPEVITSIPEVLEGGSYPQGAYRIDIGENGDDHDIDEEYTPSGMPEAGGDTPPQVSKGYRWWYYVDPEAKRVALASVYRQNE